MIRLSLDLRFPLHIPTPAPEGTLPTNRPFWRVLHDPEMPRGIWRKNVPEVFRMEPLHAIPLNRAWQLFTFELNPGMNPKKWRVLYGWFTAFTNNGAGYDHPGSPEKADFVNMRNIKSVHLPKFDQPRLCGGALVTGKVDGDYLWMDTLNTNQPPPKAESVKPWHKFCALNIRLKADGTPSLSRFPYCDGRDVIVPLISREPVRFPLAGLAAWESEEPPDPYRIYLT
jgi:hypothetical protein